jgi:hypothetical protein
MSFSYGWRQGTIKTLLLVFLDTFLTPYTTLVLYNLFLIVLVIIYAVSLSLTSFWFGDIANKAMEIEKKIF